MNQRRCVVRKDLQNLPQALFDARLEEVQLVERFRCDGRMAIADHFQDLLTQLLLLVAIARQVVEQERCRV